MINLSENKIREEIIAFIRTAIDDDLIMFYNKFGISFDEQEFQALDDDDKEFIRTDLENIVEESFEKEMVVAIKFYQILHCYAYRGVTKHNPPRFRFEELSPRACQTFLISEGIINEPI